MDTTKTILILVCAAAVLLQTVQTGVATAKSHALLDKFYALAHMKYPTTTTLPPTETSPTATIYFPTYPTQTIPTAADTFTPTLIDTPDPVSTDTLTTPITDTLVDTDMPVDTDTPVANTNTNTIVPVDVGTATPVVPAGTNGANAAPGAATGTRSLHPAYLDDEDDEPLEDEIIDSEDFDLAEGRASSAQRQRQQKLQRQKNKKRAQRNRRRQQKVKQNRRRQNALKKRQQKRRRQNNQIIRQRNERERLRRIIKQIRLYEQTNNSNRRPIRIRIRRSKQGRSNS